MNFLVELIYSFVVVTNEGNDLKTSNAADNKRSLNIESRSQREICFKNKNKNGGYVHTKSSFLCLLISRIKSSVCMCDKRPFIPLNVFILSLVDLSENIYHVNLMICALNDKNWANFQKDFLKCKWNRREISPINKHEWEIQRLLFGNEVNKE